MKEHLRKISQKTYVEKFLIRFISCFTENCGMNKKKCLLLHSSNREVSEWLKELAWKASIRVTVSWVRIPSSLHRPCKLLIYRVLILKGTKSGTNIVDFLALNNKILIYFNRYLFI